MKKLTQLSTALAVSSLLIGGCSTTPPTSITSANNKVTPGFNYKIPEQIMTPNKVKTRIGDLNFYLITHKLPLF